MVAPNTDARRRLLRKESVSSNGSHKSDMHCPRQFASRQEVLEHFQSLISEEDPFAPLSVSRNQSLDVVYTPGHGFRYVVSLATPYDAAALSTLGSEFVRTQSALFKEYSDTDHKTWCSYLGLHGDLAERRRDVVAATTVKNLGAADRLTSHQPVRRQGCSLTCYAEPDEVPGIIHSMGTRRGGRKLERQSSTTSHGRRVSTLPSLPGSKLTRSALVGFVHFSLEDGQEPYRCSKRLKRKRGENTGEYVKVHHLLVTKAHRKAGLGLLLLTAVMQRVQLFEPSYAREMFLTVLKRNTCAVRLYERLGLQKIGENTTHIGEDKSRPVEWYQMSARRDCEAIEVAADGDGDGDD